MPADTATFICGCGHSGTSLVANMFASHPDVFIPLRETEAFLSADDCRARWAELQREIAASGRRHFAEKTPRHVLAMDRIRALVPGARFVVLVRDGRDVAASFIKRHGNAAVGAKRWLTENKIVRREAMAPDVTLLRYEDLVVDAEAAMRRVCEFAGLPFDAAMLRYHEEQRLWFDVPELTKGTGAAGLEHRLLRNWQINQPLYDDRGKWKRLLGPADLALLETAEAREMLAHFGYAD